MHLFLLVASKLTEANHATPIAPKTRSLFTFYQYLKERIEKFGRNRSNFSANITGELETQTNFVRAWFVRFHFRSVLIPMNDVLYIIHFIII